jgi:NADPH-dependent 2,4-dienoyl-CoA reductase/sulfur reductase-like enzyme
MGICFECRLTIDGQPQRRSCQTACLPDMKIQTEQPVPPDFQCEVQPKPRAHAPVQAFDVLIVGAGPAGLAAACCAAESNCRVGVVDDNLAAGGQIWRGEHSQPGNPEAAHWLERLGDAPIEFVAGTQVIGDIESGRLLAECRGEPRELRYQRLIVATGARERFLPFPGWTLPGVLGAGGLQAMVKSGMPIEGRQVVVAGSGPLLLAVAAYLHTHGAKVRLVAEQAAQRSLARFGLSLLWTQPGKVRQAYSLRRTLRGIPYRPGCWPLRAEGDRQLTAITLTDGKAVWTEPCDYLACGFGLAPNLELPLLLGCEVRVGVVQVDEWQQTSRPGVYCAGESTGIGGLECSLAEGRIAGYAASEQLGRARRYFDARRHAHRFARALEAAFALRDELRQLAKADTIVCRCEDVPLERLRPYDNWRAAKLQTRCGMGPCQGRVCGGAIEFLFGWPAGSVRPPIFPTDVVNLAAIDGTT